MANRLSKITKKSTKQKPVPVRIVSDYPSPASPDKARGIDKYEAQDALRTLQRAAEIKNNKTLMRAAKAEAKSQMKTLTNVCK